MRLRIRELREQKNISINKLAKKVGVSKSTLFYIEKDITDPKLSTLKKIAEGLEVHIRELFKD